MSIGATNAIGSTSTQRRDEHAGLIIGGIVASSAVATVGAIALVGRSEHPIVEPTGGPPPLTELQLRYAPRRPLEVLEDARTAMRAAATRPVRADDLAGRIQQAHDLVRGVQLGAPALGAANLNVNDTAVSAASRDMRLALRQSDQIRIALDPQLRAVGAGGVADALRAVATDAGAGATRSGLLVLSGRDPDAPLIISDLSFPRQAQIGREATAWAMARDAVQALAEMHA